MMKTRTLLLVAIIATALMGCVESPENKSEPDPECVGVECEPEPDPKVDPVLDGTYVSAHLGNYQSCPEDGYAAGAQSAVRDLPVDKDAALAPCPEGEVCDYNLNCEDGQFTLQIANTGAAAGEGISVEKIELFNSIGESVATLPLISLIDTATGEPFDGALEVDEILTLRADFQGPVDPYSLLSVEDGVDDGSRFSGSEAGSMEVTLGADNHPDLIVEGKGIYSVPSVDT